VRWTLVLHRWVALAASIFLLIASLSGALLLFGDQGRFSATVLQLHVRLLAGDAGEWFVNGATVALLFIVPTGLLLWWRRPRFRLHKGSSRKRFLIDLHNVVGFYSAMFVLLLASTGVLLAMDEQLSAVFKGWQMPAPPHSTVPANRVPAPTPDLMLANARRAVSGGSVTQLTPARRPTSAVRIEMRGPGAFDRSTVYLDRYSAAVLRIDSLAQTPWWYRLHTAARAIHTGDVYGWTGKMLTLLSTLALAFLIVTGVMMWSRRPS
jgi:uncharacterized iron-regulated membrane protein